MSITLNGARARLAARLARIRPASPWRGLAFLCQGARPFLALSLLCLVLWLPGFTSLPPSDRDEARFVQATRQMLASGDFVDIRNGTVARNQKPIGIYWMQVPFAAAAEWLGLARNNPVWPYRMPSLLGGLAAVLASFWFGRELVGERSALLGAALLAACPLLVAETHIAKTDAALLGASTVAMGVLAQALLAPATLSRRMALLFWAMLAVSILLKGPVGPMVAGLTLLALAGWGEGARVRLALAALRPASGMVLLAALVLPWFVAIGVASHGVFFHESIGGDLAGKLVGGDDAHGAPPGLHLVLAPLLLFAAAAPAAAAVPFVWRARGLPQIRILLAWLVPSWLVFEIVPTKLPHYTLPLYPALCLLAGWFIASAFRPGPALARLACLLNLLAFVALGAGALLLPFVVARPAGISARLGLPAALVAAGTVALLVRVWARPRQAALVSLCAMPLLYWSVLGLELPGLRPLWIAPRVAQALAAHWPDGRPPDAAFAALGFAEPSLVFACGTDTALFGAAHDGVRFLVARSGRIAPDRVLAVEQHEMPALRAGLAVRGAAPAIFAQVDGFNYSNGHRVRLMLLTARPAG